MTHLRATYGNGSQATPEIGDHAFLAILIVRYNFSSSTKGNQSPRRGDDEIPCPCSSAERDFVGANPWRSHRRKALLNKIKRTLSYFE